MPKTIHIQVLNGPNFNLLGMRQPEYYGHDTLADIEANCTALAQTAGARIGFLQSNHEGALIDAIHEARGVSEAIVINPGAYSHSSVGILDALNAFEGLVLECHISNIHQRESFRHHSFISQRADGVIAGFGIQGYELCVLRAMAVLGARVDA